MGVSFVSEGTAMIKSFLIIMPAPCRRRQSAIINYTTGRGRCQGKMPIFVELTGAGCLPNDPELWILWESFAYSMIQELKNHGEKGGDENQRNG